jgi:hypothetical protein
MMWISEVEMNDLNNLCEVCVKGKQTKLPHSGTRPKTARPLERIHSDPCGPDRDR